LRPGAYSGIYGTEMSNRTSRDKTQTIHISQKINKAYSMIGIIKRNFIHTEEKHLFYYIKH